MEIVTPDLELLKVLTKSENKSDYKKCQDKNLEEKMEENRRPRLEEEEAKFLVIPKCRQF